MLTGSTPAWCPRAESNCRSRFRNRLRTVSDSVPASVWAGQGAFGCVVGSSDIGS